MKKIFKTLMIALIASAAMTGCASGENSNTTNINETSSQISIDWQAVIGHIEGSDMSGTGLYIDTDQAKEDAEEFGYISFNNYGSDFRSVDKQIDICYGKIMKTDTESEVYFDEPAFEISVLDNSNYESFYHGVYSENGDTLFEEGEWILADDKSETVSDWINICSQAIGDINGQ